MPAAQEITNVAPGILIWQTYDPEVKADLFSTALETPAGRYLVDPIELVAGVMETVWMQPKIRGIVVTNENHERSAQTFSERFSVPIYAGEEAGIAGRCQPAIQLAHQQQIQPGLTAINIEGAPAGEVALHYEPDGGTLVIGDALINWEPYGFALLPPKYCRAFKLMKRSLWRLTEYPFERMLFAHGMPILSGARAKLEQLLAGTRK